jgi:PAS domain S-box-containing protein
VVSWSTSPIIEKSPLAIVVLDAGHRVQMCNPAFERLFGYAQEEIAGTQLDELIAPADENTQAVRFTRRILAGEHVHAIGQRCRKDGSLVDVEIHGVPLLAGDKLIGIYGIYQDRTEHLQAERALRVSEERYRLLFDANPHPMWVYDLDTLVFRSPLWSLPGRIPLHDHQGYPAGGGNRSSAGERRPGEGRHRCRRGVETQKERRDAD